MIGKSDLVAAVGHALASEGTQAHEIVQKDEQDDMACWIHAVLHRQEGDLSNASYWYARCGRRLCKGLSPEDELREINETLTRRT